MQRFGCNAEKHASSADLAKQLKKLLSALNMRKDDADEDKDMDKVIKALKELERAFSSQQKRWTKDEFTTLLGALGSWKADLEKLKKKEEKTAAEEAKLAKLMKLERTVWGVWVIVISFFINIVFIVFSQVVGFK